MNADIKAQWVDALRSGKYTQGQNVLRETIDGSVTHCCLGVLCELAVEAGVVWRVEEASAGEGMSNTAFDDNVSFLPESVQNWSGVFSYNGGFWEDEAHDDWQTLTGLNDSGYSFDEIADIIESKF